MIENSVLIPFMQSCDDYSSHLPIFNWIFSRLKINSVFEFGCGNYSTEIFIKNCQMVESVEMQSLEWFNIISEKYRGTLNHSIQCLLGANAGIDHFNTQNKNWDLVFVDGSGESRWHAINCAFKKTNLIVAHDTQEPSYNWNKVALPIDWNRVDFTVLTPWTTVFFKNGVL
jgi:hypothetical protein